MLEDREEISQHKEEHHAILKNLKLSKIIIPVFLGILVIVYLTWRDMDAEFIHQIQWNDHTLYWVLVAIALLIIRHLAYAVRLRYLTDFFFGWLKSIELIFVWEFSSAISPTSLGGSVVALFMLVQEKLSVAKTTTAILYSVVMDTLFFALFFPLLYFTLGAQIIRPGAQNFLDLSGWGWSMLTLYIAMIAYGTFFFIGLFVQPRRIKYTLIWFTRIKWLRRYRRNAIRTGDNVIMSAKELKHKTVGYHLMVFAMTTIAWSCRFLILNALIIAFVPDTPLNIFDQVILYGRSESIFLLMSFSPTPGSSGVAELIFGGFLTDYVIPNLAMVIASSWRFLTYYFYLFAGLIIIPNWIREVVSYRKKKQL